MHDPNDTKQIELDPEDVSIDSPGATGTGTVIVRSGETGFKQVSARRREEKSLEEQRRIAAFAAATNSPEELQAKANERPAGSENLAEGFEPRDPHAQQDPSVLTPEELARAGADDE